MFFLWCCGELLGVFIAWVCNLILLCCCWIFFAGLCCFRLKIGSWCFGDRRGEEEAIGAGGGFFIFEVPSGVRFWSGFLSGGVVVGGIVVMESSSSLEGVVFLVFSLLLVVLVLGVKNWRMSWLIITCSLVLVVGRSVLGVVLDDFGVCWISVVVSFSDAVSVVVLLVVDVVVVLMGKSFCITLVVSVVAWLLVVSVSGAVFVGSLCFVACLFLLCGVDFVVMMTLVEGSCECRFVFAVKACCTLSVLCGKLGVCCCTSFPSVVLIVSITPLSDAKKLCGSM